MRLRRNAVAMFLGSGVAVLFLACSSPASQALLEQARLEATPTIQGSALPTVAPAVPGVIPAPTQTRSEPSLLERLDAAFDESSLTPVEVHELRLFALGLVNKDRADHELPPVVLGSNQAAQLHAEDMLANDYFGHWWLDGRKPYMVYSQTGGGSYAAENVAVSGWTEAQWAESNCDNLLVRCTVTDPAEAIEQHEWAMMYDDAHADWGHRDNILGESHRAVSIGIASDGRRSIFVQHFEGGDAVADIAPQLDPFGRLYLSITKVATPLSVGQVVSVYYDPLPTSKTPEQIDTLDRYCVGNGFTTACGDSIANILPPPGEGRHYPNLGASDVVASEWEESPFGFRFEAELGDLATTPGVYTVVVWRDTGSPTYSEALVQLSAFQE